jgi:class 3 adenylate cyclase
MELLADRDPEDARQLLDPVLEALMAAVHRNEGTVHQVWATALWRCSVPPLAHEDHAVRASYAALAMQASVKQYATEVQRTKGVPIYIRVGLNSGAVVVRSIGSDLHMDYTAVGQTTHLASRMERMAMPGSILITADVLRLVEGYDQVTSLGPVTVKGLRVPVELYAPVGVGPVRSGAAPAGVAQYAALRRGGHARGTWALIHASHPDPLSHGAEGVKDPRADRHTLLRPSSCCRPRRRSSQEPRCG